MTERNPPPTHSDPDAERRARRMELIISTVLRTGVLLSLAIIVTGTILSFVHHPAYLSSPAELQRLVQPGAAFPHTWSDIVAGVRDLHGQAIVTVGLLVLIATPVARVGISIAAFAYQRDRIFVLITSVVFCLLLLSFAMGAVE